MYIKLLYITSLILHFLSLPFISSLFPSPIFLFLSHFHFIQMLYLPLSYITALSTFSSLSLILYFPLSTSSSLIHPLSSILFSFYKASFFYSLFLHFFLFLSVTWCSYFYVLAWKSIFKTLVFAWVWTSITVDWRNTQSFDQSNRLINLLLFQPTSKIWIKINK